MAGNFREYQTIFGSCPKIDPKYNPNVTQIESDPTGRLSRFGLSGKWCVKVYGARGACPHNLERHIRRGYFTLAANQGINLDLL